MYEGSLRKVEMKGVIQKVYSVNPRRASRVGEPIQGIGSHRRSNSEEKTLLESR